MMFFIWWLSVRRNNGGFVDVGWSLGLVILAVWYAWQGPGFAPRRWLMAGMVAFWGLRLAVHLIRRIAAEPEDGRYQQLRREWAGKNVNLRFLFFFEFNRFKSSSFFRIFCKNYFVPMKSFWPIMYL